MYVRIINVQTGTHSPLHIVDFYLFRFGMKSAWATVRLLLVMRPRCTTPYRSCKLVNSMSTFLIIYPEHHVREIVNQAHRSPIFPLPSQLNVLTSLQIL